MLLKRALVWVGVVVGFLGVPGGAVAQLSVVGAYSDPTTISGATSVAVSGTTAWTTAYWPGQLTAVDFSDPAHPAPVGTTGTFKTALQNGSNVTIAGSDAFVVSKNRNASAASNDDGSGNALTIVDTSTPTTPVVRGTVHDSQKLFGAYGVAVGGNTAYVGFQGLLAGQPSTPDTSTGGFSVLDVTNKASPTIVSNTDNGSLPAPWTGTNALFHATSVAVSGHYAYVTAFRQASMTVVDIANPSSPTIVASLHDAANLSAPADLAVQGNYVYVANQSSFSPEFSVIDVSNPANPRLVGTLTNNQYLVGAYRLHVRGSFAYVAASGSGAVAAIDISDPTAPRLADAVQDSSHLTFTTGLDLSSSGRYAIASSPRSASETNQAFPLFTNTTGTISDIDLIPNPIAVTISAASEPPNQTTQTSASFTFSINDGVSTARCSLDGGTFGLCTSATTQKYASVGVGGHTFTVHASDAAGGGATASYSWTVVGPPVNTGLPVISGTAALGAQLKVSKGTWAGSPTSYAPQWRRCSAARTHCVPIKGATNGTYTTVAADVGSRLEAVVTARNPLGSGVATSAETAIVAGPARNRSAPRILGQTAVGATVTATRGTWSGTIPTSYTYQWEHCRRYCLPISRAIAKSYRLRVADLGTRLRVVVRARSSAGAATATSRQVGPVYPSLRTIGAALSKVMAPPSRNASIQAVLRARGLKFVFVPPWRGRLMIDWYLVPKGALLAAGSAQAPKPVLIAAVTARFRAGGGRTSVTVKLTKAGVGVLKHSTHLKLTVKTKTGFLPAGGTWIYRLSSFRLK